MGTALEDTGKAGATQGVGAFEEELEVAQGRYDDAMDDLRKARKPLLKTSEDLATFNSGLAAALLSGRLTEEQKQDAIEARAALAMPFGERVSKFAALYRQVLEAGRALAEAEKAAAEAADDAG